MPGHARSRQDLRIATLYRRHYRGPFEATDMSLVRWLRISEAFARLGYQVDMIVDAEGTIVERGPGLRQVPYADARWGDYDVVKTLFHKGAAALREVGMDGHPFIVSKLGSVVGPTDDEEGVHFFGDERTWLWEVQTNIARTARYVTLLTDPSRQLWQREFGGAERCLFAPTGVDAVIPPRGPNPYPFPEPVVLYSGTLYSGAQREVNLLWQTKLNELGTLLHRRGIRLCLLGAGDVDQLDPDAVTQLGAVENDRVWDYHYWARAGIALAQGPVQHNESSKIYYYLRAGLPVVAEAPIPNCDLIHAARLGFVAPWNDSPAMADLITDAVRAEWDRDTAMRYVIEHHTWDRRAAIYDRVIRRDFALDPPAA